jgi:WD40 repeat protein
MAVVRSTQGRNVLEYPLGDVLEDEAELYTPRISPDGRHVAVFYSGPESTGMTVRIYERFGQLVLESEPVNDWWSLAWMPDGELWFAATETEGSQAAVFGLHLNGRRRLVYRAPGSLTIHDISRQGELLASFDQYRTRAELLGAVGAGEPLDRSWKGGARPAGLSDDHAVLFRQTGDSGGPDGSVFIWRPDEPQPVRISAGVATALSNDGELALVRSPESWSVVPTGTGQRTVIEVGELGGVSWAGWHPDGRLVLSGTDAGGGAQLYALPPSGGTPIELLSEGLEVFGGRALSPDGARVVAWDRTQSQTVVCVLATSTCEPVPGLEPADDVAGWSEDNRSIFVYRRWPVPANVDRVDVTTGERVLWKAIDPTQAAVSGLRVVIASPDGALVYSYSRARTQLYVVRGLK